MDLSGFHWTATICRKSTSTQGVEAETGCGLVYQSVICLGCIPGPLWPVIELLGWYSDDRQARGPMMSFCCVGGATEGLDLSTYWPPSPNITVVILKYGGQNNWGQWVKKYNKKQNK